MKKLMKKIAVITLACTLLTGMLTACAKTGDAEQSTTETSGTTTEDTQATEAPAAEATDTTETTELSGTLTMAGSTSMEKVANILAEAFMAKYPGVTASAEFIGSGAGIEALTAGTVDIGNSSRNLKDTEKSAGAVENIIAIDGIAVILEKSNTVTDLTKDQLIKIYTGEITNWSEVGGADQPIVVIGRESGSGTRDAFEELNGIAEKCKYANELNSTGGVMAKVASTIGAIGYVSLDVLDDTVTAAKLDGAEPTEANIKAGTYYLNRPFVMATMGEISAQNEIVKTFFDYINSDEGKEMIKSAGLITVD